MAIIDINEIEPAAAAWARVSTDGYLPTLRDVRSAIAYAGAQIAADIDWLTIDRYRVIHDAVHVGRINDLPQLIEDLVLESWYGCGLRIMRVIDSMVTCERLS